MSKFGANFCQRSISIGDDWHKRNGEEKRKWQEKKQRKNNVSNASLPAILSIKTRKFSDRMTGKREETIKWF